MSKPSNQLIEKPVVSNIDFAEGRVARDRFLREEGRRSAIAGAPK
jgi:hypothetical protein